MAAVCLIRDVDGRARPDRVPRGVDIWTLEGPRARQPSRLDLIDEERRGPRVSGQVGTSSVPSLLMHPAAIAFLRNRWDRWVVALTCTGLVLVPVAVSSVELWLLRAVLLALTPAGLPFSIAGAR